MKKVTWETSRRIHATNDDKSTICGYIFAGNDKNVSSNTCICKKRKHCKTCFVEKGDYRSPWLNLTY